MSVERGREGVSQILMKGEEFSTVKITALLRSRSGASFVLTQLTACVLLTPRAKKDGHHGAFGIGPIGHIDERTVNKPLENTSAPHRL